MPTVPDEVSASTTDPSPRPTPRPRPAVLVRVVAVLVAAVLALSASSGSGSEGDIVVGTPEAPTTKAPAGPTIVTFGDDGPRLAAALPPAGRSWLRVRARRRGPKRARASGLKPADGRPYGAAVTFASEVPVPEGLVFVLVVGSDARPKQDVLRANADAIHLLAVNPRTLQGTVVGFPRDAWVAVPGRGMAKLSTVLNHGPDVLAETVRRLTGLPVHHYVLTSFDGLVAMVDALGGVDVLVDRRMDDRSSGARFQPGWHHFTGVHALAFSRNRKFPTGDFTRSENQGKLLVAALAKMRAEVGDDAGLRRWLGLLVGRARLDVPPARLLELAALARRLDPAQVRNVVVPGRIGKAARQSVVFLNASAASAMFADLRPDAVLGPPGPEVPTTTTTTTAPPPPPPAP